MSDHFEVRPAELVAHAGRIELIGDQVATAKQAGAVVQAGIGAYGQLCGMVPLMLSVLQDVLIDGIGAAADSLHDTGGRLRTVAQEYESADQRQAQALDAIRGTR